MASTARFAGPSVCCGMAELLNEQKSKKRIYKPRESPLASERERGNPYAQGIFNFVTVHIMLIPLALVLRDIYNPGSLKRRLDGLSAALGGPQDWLLTALIILLEFLITFFVYLCFGVWAVCYRQVGRPANVVFLILLAGSVIGSRYYLVSYLFEINFPPGARFACCTHQLILFLKWISFIYENAYKVLYPWHKDDETGPAVWYAGQMDPQIGSFSSFLYFLFCPVLLYRDRYPRKPPNFKKASVYFIQFISMVGVSYILLFDFGIPESMKRDTLMQVCVQNLLLGFLILTSGHTCLIHGWTHCWAELLGFADQTFYEDWWNSRSMPEYLRKWNPIIYDWLKSYMFSQFKKLLPTSLAILLVLVVSAFEHDFVISTGVGFFMPVYVLQYGIGGMLLNLKPPLSPWADQMIMCFGLSVGFGLQITFYCSEVAARIYCPTQTDSWLRIVDCYRQFN